MSNEIIYPMTLDYVPQWGQWEVVRELMTNALDEDENASLTMNESGALVVRSKGRSLSIQHLLFGMTEKSNPNSIGQFGEGLKLALLVLTRMELTAHIYSGRLHIWNEPAEMAGKQVFKIVWQERKETDETVVGIPNWPGETFEDRFIRAGDPRIVYTDQFGRSILEQDVPDIFVKRVWVQKATGYGNHYAFGYDLRDPTMNRDRGVVGSWEVNIEIGKIWATVTDAELLARFWQAVKDGSGEHSCNMRGVNVTEPKAMKTAFQDVFGSRVVLQTSDGARRQAEYRGASTVTASQVGQLLADVVADLVGTDADHVQQMEGQARVHVPDKKLPEDAQKILRLLRRLAGRVKSPGRILAYILPPEVVGERHGDDIRVSVAQLSDPSKSIGTWLHEEAHRRFDTPDDSIEHTAAVTIVAADVIASYATR